MAIAIAMTLLGIASLSRLAIEQYATAVGDG